MKPTILLDMDGPISGFDQRIFEEARSRGWRLDIDYDHRQQQHRYSTDHFLDDAERRLMRDLCDGPGWFAGLPVVDGALDGLADLDRFIANGDIDVWICTKPLRAAWRTCHSEKASWVEERLGPQWTDRLIIAPDKSLVRGTILVDDAPYIEWLERAEWEPVMFDLSWNREGSPWGELTERWTWEDGVHALIGAAYGIASRR